MNKRLSFEQKYEMIYNLLLKSARSMTSYEIGKHFGYSGGKAMKEVLNWMVETERAKVEIRPYRFGNTGYYRLNPVYAKYRLDNLRSDDEI